jgi:hypothetical protein
MRAFTLLICSLAVASAFAQKVAPLIGSWKSPDVGMGDFPMWMVDTYHADGTCDTNVYAQPGKQPLHDPSKILHRVYRLEGDSLLIGTLIHRSIFMLKGCRARCTEIRAGVLLRSTSGFVSNRPNQVQPTQHFVVSFGLMRTPIFKVLGG